MRATSSPWRTAAVLATALAALTACGSGGGASGAADGTPRTGGTLTFAVGSDAGCVDPQQVGSNDTIYSNNARPPLDDEKVRRAITLAVDRKQIAQTVFPSGTRPATSVLAHTTPGYTDVGASLALDQAQAKALLDAAGWTPGSDGVRQKGGRKLALTVTWFANAATNKPALELLQQQLKAVGVQVALQEKPIAQLTQVQRSGAFDLLWGNVTRADPDILRSSFSTRLANLYKVPATGLDGLLDGQAAASDQAERWELVAKAQRDIVQHAYTVPVVELQTELGVAKKVHGVLFDASSRIQLHDAWIG
ncbi:ABC transporter substrate-binding protein [Actinomadura opuntiae]|uniref:ABC transporter substrate-binding protein n=1 Tax=Actinomadura sp. OS1-43 TaxID=604315 RepID=UPI00255B0136|nr:ABC transporter substrate-binding protein [Actinomadura sp. OS1-43]MDL4816490.1 ABC transporter substrate-binding protein [Actinomadura sp. OS1-43]